MLGASDDFQQVIFTLQKLFGKKPVWFFSPQEGVFIIRKGYGTTFG